MKVIKHLRYDTPEQRLKQFFRLMPLLTKVCIILTFILSLTYLLVVPNAQLQHTSFRIMSWITVRPLPDMIIFMIAGISDFNREEKKGSIFFLISSMIKSLLCGILSLMIDWLLVVHLGFESIALMNITSWPMMFLLVIAMRDMLVCPSSQRYIFCEPFHIKALYYPIFLCIILEIVHFRIDLLYVFIASLIIRLCKLDTMVNLISFKLDGWILGQRLIEMGLVATGMSDAQDGRQIDRVVTNSSIVLQEK